MMKTLGMALLVVLNACASVGGPRPANGELPMAFEVYNGSRTAVSVYMETPLGLQRQELGRVSAGETKWLHAPRNGYQAGDVLRVVVTNGERSQVLEVKYRLGARRRLHFQ